MLNLPQQTLHKIKTILMRQQKNVEERLVSLEKDDPILNGAVEASESGTESWEADVHSKVQKLKSDLLDLSEKIKTSLFRINKGIYGKCENCGKSIESERLEAMPTAVLCMVCSQKPKSLRK